MIVSFLPNTHLFHYVIYPIVSFSVDSVHEAGFWPMGYGLKICKLLPVLMRFFSPLFPFYITLGNKCLRWY